MGIGFLIVFVLLWCPPVDAADLAVAADRVAEPGEPRQFGNMLFVNLAVGDTYQFLGKPVRLAGIEKDWAVVDVGGEEARVELARLVLPTVVNGVRIYLSDTRLMANYTPNPRRQESDGVRGAVTKDALLCLSDPAKPLLDPDRFTFPIDRSDGYEWNMGTDSHTFAFLSEHRQHEGTDFSIAKGRTEPMHALVAVEDAKVVWVRKHSGEQAAVLLESVAQPGVYYTYQHLEAATLRVRPGQAVKRGEKLAYIWGDNRWGHLHFGIPLWGPPPPFENRYRYSIAAFPILYELWNGDLEPRPKTWTFGEWTFARAKGTNHNVKRLNAFNELLGYGWLLGDWCPSKRVEPTEQNDKHLAALLFKTLFAETGVAVTNPTDHYDFEIAVPNGRYALRAMMGDGNLPTWQRVSFEGVEMGVFELEPNRFAWTEEQIVRVTDGRLTIRIELRDDETPGSLSEIMFGFMDYRNPK